MIELDGATFLLQWATGGLLFLWVTTRRREVGLGYGWLMRSVFAVLIVGSIVAGVMFNAVELRETASGVALLLVLIALALSIQWRRGGVRGQQAEHDRRSKRVAAMTGIERDATERDSSAQEFPPWLDALAPVAGVVGLVAASFVSEGPTPLAVARTLVGAAFLGALTDAMLLGHWYLVQPGLSRNALHEIVDWVLRLWPFEVAAMLLPTGMISVWTGAVDDDYGGLLGWFWAACALSTVALAVVTKLALRERQYSAVMAATGLLYLAILTGFGTDLVARAVLRT